MLVDYDKDWTGADSRPDEEEMKKLGRRVDDMKEEIES
jgi:hypothetical protein